MAPVICCCSTLSQFSVESRYYSRVCCCGGWWSVCLAGGCLAAHCLLATLPFALSSGTAYFPWRRQPAEPYSFWHGSRSLWLPFWRCCTASLASPTLAERRALVTFLSGRTGQIRGRDRLSLWLIWGSRGLRPHTRAHGRRWQDDGGRAGEDH